VARIERVQALGECSAFARIAARERAEPRLVARRRDLAAPLGVVAQLRVQRRVGAREAHRDDAQRVRLRVVAARFGRRRVLAQPVARPRREVGFFEARHRGRRILGECERAVDRGEQFARRVARERRPARRRRDDEVDFTAGTRAVAALVRRQRGRFRGRRRGGIRGGHEREAMGPERLPVLVAPFGRETPAAARLRQHEHAALVRRRIAERQREPQGTSRHRREHGGRHRDVARDHRKRRRWRARTSGEQRDTRDGRDLRTRRHEDSADFGANRRGLQDGVPRRDDRGGRRRCQRAVSRLRRPRTPSRWSPCA
jgi:hypothetical protein